MEVCSSPRSKLKHSKTLAPTEERRVNILVTIVHLFSAGSYLSTEFNELDPSLPPNEYKNPPASTTSCVDRREFIVLIGSLFDLIDIIFNNFHKIKEKNFHSPRVRSQVESFTRAHTHRPIAAANHIKIVQRSDTAAASPRRHAWHRHPASDPRVKTFNWRLIVWRVEAAESENAISQNSDATIASSGGHCRTWWPNAGQRIKTFNRWEAARAVVPSRNVK